MPKLPDTPTVHFQLPTVALLGDDAAARNIIHAAQLHGRYLDIQFYALTILDMFNSHPGLESVEVSMHSDHDGFLHIDEPEFADGQEEDFSDVMGQWAETINDRRDESFMGFIEHIIAEESWQRDGIEELIEEAYDALAENDSMPTWRQVAKRREVLMQARELEQATPANTTQMPRPRM